MAGVGVGAVLVTRGVAVASRADCRALTVPLFRADMVVGGMATCVAGSGSATCVWATTAGAAGITDVTPGSITAGSALPAVVRYTTFSRQWVGAARATPQSITTHALHCIIFIAFIQPSVCLSTLL